MVFRYIAERPPLNDAPLKPGDQLTFGAVSVDVISRQEPPAVDSNDWVTTPNAMCHAELIRHLRKDVGRLQLDLGRNVKELTTWKSLAHELQGRNQSMDDSLHRESNRNVDLRRQLETALAETQTHVEHAKRIQCECVNRLRQCAAKEEELKYIARQLDEHNSLLNKTRESVLNEQERLGTLRKSCSQWNLQLNDKRVAIEQKSRQHTTSRARLDDDRKAIEAERDQLAVERDHLLAAKQVNDDRFKALKIEEERLLSDQRECRSLRERLEQERAEIGQQSEELANTAGRIDKEKEMLKAEREALRTERETWAEEMQAASDKLEALELQEQNLLSEQIVCHAERHDLAQERAAIARQSEELADATERIDREKETLQAERKELRTERESWAEEMQAASDKLEELELREQHLVSEQNAVHDQRDGLAEQSAAIERKSEELGEAADKINQENETLQAEREALRIERESWADEKQAASQKLEELKSQEQMLSSEQNAIRAERDGLADEHAANARKSEELAEATERINQENETLQAKRESLRTESESLVEEIENTRRQLEEIRADRERLLSEPGQPVNADHGSAASAEESEERFAQEKEALSAERKKLHADQTAWAAEVQAVEQQLEELRANEERLVAEQNDCQVERENLEHSRSSFEKQSEELAEVVETINRERAALESERTRLESEQEAWQAERDAWKEPSDAHSDTNEVQRQIPDHERTEELARLAQQRDELQAERAQFQAQREAWEAEAEAVRTEQAAWLEQVQAEIESERAALHANGDPAMETSMEPDAMDPMATEPSDGSHQADHAFASDGHEQTDPQEYGRGDATQSETREYDEGESAETTDHDSIRIPETPAEMTFEQVSDEAPANVMDILAERGETPAWEADDYDNQTSGASDLELEESFQQDPAEIDPTYPGTIGNEDGEDESIDKYMSQLLRRVSGDEAANTFQGQSNEPKSVAPEAVPETPHSNQLPTLGDVDIQLKQDQPELGQYVPRATAPERTTNMEAMRELANMSARSAIDTYQKRRSGRSFFWRLAGAGISVGLGVTAITVGSGHVIATPLAAIASFGLAAYLTFDAARFRWFANSPTNPQPAEPVEEETLEDTADNVE